MRIEPNHEIPNQYISKYPNLIMSLPELDSIRNNRTKDIQKDEFMNILDKEISKVTGEVHFDIFKTIMEKKKDPNYIGDEILDSESIRDIEGLPANTPIEKLPKELLGKILSVMDEERKELVYVQRNTMTIKNLMNLFQFFRNDMTLGFHVSDYEIKGKKLIPGPNENSVYYSNNITHLFNNKNDGKFIYAFMISKKTDQNADYGATENFRKLYIPQNSGIEIMDSVAIFKKEDPNYQAEILNKLGASFDKNYRGAGARGEMFMDGK